jgi:hypothetical protein
LYLKGRENSLAQPIRRAAHSRSLSLPDPGALLNR